MIDLTDGDATLLSKATTYNRYFTVLIFLTTYLDYSNGAPFKLVSTYKKSRFAITAYEPSWTRGSTFKINL